MISSDCNATTRGLAAAVGLFAICACVDVAAQQTFPVRPVRMLTTVSAGSAVDFLARTIGPRLNDLWGHQLVIDNRPSAGGIVASQILVGATPDGHTLLINSIGHAVNASLYSKLPYDTLRDFAGVTMVADIPNVLVATPGLGWKSVRDLIDAARAKPGTVNFASAGIGSGTHMNGEAFKLLAGINVIHVPFKGTPEALNDTIAGRVQYFFAPITAAIPLVKAGRVTGLAVSTANRSPALPELPTVAESGVAGFDFNLWTGIFAPARTPRPVKEKVAADIARVLAQPDVKERMLTQGAVPNTLAIEKFDAFVKSEVEKLAHVIRASGAKAN